MKIRSFIAVDIDDDVRKKIARLIRDLSGCGAPVKWVEKHNLHLTLKFLGDIPAEDTALLAGILDEAAEGIDPFDIDFEGVGTFPEHNPDHPRVVWVGARDDGQLREMANNLEALCSEQLGVRPEGKGFKAHLTLGRLRTTQGVQTLVDKLKTLKDTSFGSSSVDRIVAYQSTLHADRPEYVKLATRKL